MTQRSISLNAIGTTPARPPRTTPTRRDPWWIPLGEAITSLFGSAAPPAGTSAADLPAEVLRDHDPALHRALAARVAGRDLDPGTRPLLY